MGGHHGNLARPSVLSHLETLTMALLFSETLLSRHLRLPFLPLLCSCGPTTASQTSCIGGNQLLTRGLSLSSKPIQATPNKQAAKGWPQLSRAQGSPPPRLRLVQHFRAAQRSVHPSHPQTRTHQTRQTPGLPNPAASNERRAAAASRHKPVHTSFSLPLFNIPDEDPNIDSPLQASPHTRLARQSAAVRGTIPFHPPLLFPRCILSREKWSGPLCPLVVHTPLPNESQTPARRRRQPLGSTPTEAKWSTYDKIRRSGRLPRDADPFRFRGRPHKPRLQNRRPSGNHTSE